MLLSRNNSRGKVVKYDFHQSLTMFKTGGTDKLSTNHETCHKDLFSCKKFEKFANCPKKNTSASKLNQTDSNFYRSRNYIKTPLYTANNCSPFKQDDTNNFTIDNSDLDGKKKRV